MYKAKKIIFLIIGFCMMISRSVCAMEQVSTQIEISTDRSRQIVFEQLNGEGLYTSTVNQKGYQSLTYNEPGNYEYRVYESKNSADRDTREYIATVCVIADESTGQLKEPIVAIDYADNSGKPGKLVFGTSTPPEETPSEPQPSEPDNPVPGNSSNSNRNRITNRNNHTTPSTPQRTSKTTPRTTTIEDNKTPLASFVQTGDRPLLIIYTGLFILCMLGFFITAGRKDNEEI